jgi:hypothetical protein
MRIGRPFPGEGLMKKRSRNLLTLTLAGAASTPSCPECGRAFGGDMRAILERTT